MNIPATYILLLLGHIIADFYLQPNIMAKEKGENYKWLFCHAGVYAVGMGIILLLGIPYSFRLLQLWISVSILHLIIDLCKKVIKNKTCNNSILLWIQKHIFTIDQCIHIITLIITWRFLGKPLLTRPFEPQAFAHLPADPISILLCIIILFRPVGNLIASGDIWKLGIDKSKKSQTDDSGSKENAGKMIGYLERFIIFLFLLYNQYSAVAFILTAKSVARYKEIENNQLTAEDYLIGTLLSVVSVLIVKILFIK